MQKGLIKRHACLVGVLIFTVVLLVISLLNWESPELTYSQHIALEDWSIVLFAITNVAVAILMGVGMLQYIKPRLGLGRVYAAISIVFLVMLLLVGLFPHLPGSRTVSTIIHESSAAILFESAFVWIAVVVASRWSKLANLIKTVGMTIMAFALLLVVMMFFFADVFVSGMFFFEVGYLWAILLFVLLVNYMKPSK